MSGANRGLLLTIGPEPGNINAGVALARLVAGHGVEPHLLTSPSAREHITRIGVADDGTLSSIEYSSSHELDFNRNSPGRRPHVQQLCDASKINACVLVERDAVRRCGAGLIINKHYYSAAISAALAGIPYGMIYTDGPNYLRPGGNPQQSHVTPECVAEVSAAHLAHGLHMPSVPPPYSLRSHGLNIVRGSRRSAALEDDVMDWLDGACFAGNLTFSGGDFTPLPATVDRRPRAYVTFGTISNNPARLMAVVRGLLRRGVAVVCSYYKADLPVRPSDVEHVTYAHYLRSDSVLAQVDFVVHHGGHGTYLEAMAAGIPQIIIPDNVSSTAQALHGQNAQHLGIGRLVLADSIEEQFDQAVSVMLSPSTRDLSAEEGRRFRLETDELQASLVERIIRVLDRRAAPVAADGEEAMVAAISRACE